MVQIARFSCVNIAILFLQSDVCMHVVCVYTYPDNESICSQSTGERQMAPQAFLSFYTMLHIISSKDL